MRYTTPEQIKYFSSPLQTTKNLHFFCEDKKYSYICTVEVFEAMEVTFNEKYLQDLYEKGKADKKHRFQPHIVRKYGDIVNLMKRETNVLELLKYKSLNYEKLKGDKVGLSSVRVNDQYRIEFEERMENDKTIATICNITELSNHYK